MKTIAKWNPPVKRTSYANAVLTRRTLFLASVLFLLPISGGRQDYKAFTNISHWLREHSTGVIEEVIISHHRPRRKAPRDRALQTSERIGPLHWEISQRFAQDILAVACSGSLQNGFTEDRGTHHRKIP